MVVFGVIVLLILLVIGDRVALAVAENDMADQFVSNGFPVKPSVTISPRATCARSTSPRATSRPAR
jgi:hypothetical protein